MQTGSIDPRVTQLGLLAKSGTTSSHSLYVSCCEEQFDGQTAGVRITSVTASNDGVTMVITG